ncbi:TetR/AcrR family transcriptional regulator [Nocardia kruczakiae]|uniref:TetR/AcrR family transcriptional regulator n=1 Tax=Nocardia kruczakiae TaxID=261477 RepID=UPI0007A4BAC9|nr:TetR/AcrR family transcriptional regulator [Nocardia kruczakiae]
MAIPSPSEPAPIGGRQARWQTHNDRRRGRIVEALIELLEESGGGEISMQQIAKRSGLAKSVVYRQFSGRDELDRRARSVIAEQFIDTVDAALDIWDGSIHRILHRTVAAVADWLTEHARLYDFARSGPAMGDPDDVDALSSIKATIAARTRLLVSSLAGVIGVVDEATADTMTFAIVSMTEATVGRWARDPDPLLSREQLISEVAGYAWSVLDGAARAHGLTLDPELPLIELINALAEGVNDIP